MARSSPFVRVCVALLCLAVLAMRMGGAHLHLCFDGGSPAATVQVADADMDHASGDLQKPHHDLDISLVGEAFAQKQLDGVLELPVLLAAVLVLFISREVRLPLLARDRAPAIHPISAFLIRPPLRGPPR